MSYIKQLMLGTHNLYDRAGIIRVPHSLHVSKSILSLGVEGEAPLASVGHNASSIKGDIDVALGDN